MLLYLFFLLFVPEWFWLYERNHESVRPSFAGCGSLGYVMEPVMRSVQTQIVNALRLGERSTASSLLSDIACRNNSLTANDFVYILEYCARSPDPLVGSKMIFCFDEAI